MSTLQQVLQHGLAAAIPAAGNAGRVYFATDTSVIYQDNGAAWVSVFTAGATAALTNVVLAPSSAGNFTIAHGVGSVPSAVAITMTSAGFIWEYAAPDAINLYLTASHAGITGKAICFQ